ncbi:hypothetical protein VTJ49DRAFT_1624 [Mycothermus thermophilus]|uniref:Uncharacterized protein n=1 Tax=Humicola insolens TaxID=85995 RepID=A0ABR3VDZ7_HUMIN
MARNKGHRRGDNNRQNNNNHHHHNNNNNGRINFNDGNNNTNNTNNSRNNNVNNNNNGSRNNNGNNNGNNHRDGNTYNGSNNNNSNRNGNNNRNSNGNGNGNRNNHNNYNNRNNHPRILPWSDIVHQLISTRPGQRPDPRLLQMLISSASVMLELTWDVYERRGLTDAQIARELALPWQACARLAHFCDRANVGLMEAVVDAEGDVMMVDVDDERARAATARDEAHLPAVHLVDLLMRDLRASLEGYEWRN